MTCLDAIQKGQCFPLYWYEKYEEETDDGTVSGSQGWGLNRSTTVITASGGTKFIRHDAITDETLDVFRQAYSQNKILNSADSSAAKEEIFYYVYGVLHSAEYRSRFEQTLRKELARIPLAQDFSVFAKAGRQLAQLHLNYENTPHYVGKGKIQEEWTDGATPTGPTFEDLQVSKLAFGKMSKNSTSSQSGKKVDRTRIIYNPNLTLTGIPEKADEYQVSGRSPIEWIIDQYQCKTDTTSGIVNDPNAWIQQTGNPRYLVDLIESLVTVSLQTVKIIDKLPALNELPQTANWPEAWRTQ